MEVDFLWCKCGGNLVRYPAKSKPQIPPDMSTFWLQHGHEQINKTGLAKRSSSETLPAAYEQNWAMQDAAILNWPLSVNWSSLRLLFEAPHFRHDWLCWAGSALTSLSDGWKQPIKWTVQSHTTAHKKSASNNTMTRSEINMKLNRKVISNAHVLIWKCCI